MPKTNKAATTIQELPPNHELASLAQTIDTCRSVKASAERTSAEAKAQVVETVGLGVFHAGPWEVQVQFIEPTAKPVLDTEALRDFLATVDKRIEDFLIPGKPAEPHNRVNVERIIPEAPQVIHELGAHQ